MQRFLIGGIAAVVVLLATAGIFVAARDHLQSSAETALEARVQRAAKQYEQISRLEGMEFAALASRFSARDGAQRAIAVSDETERVKQVFTEVEAINKHLEAGGHRADVVALLDQKGRVVARDLNPNAMRGDDLGSTFPAVGLALKGEAVKDIWSFAGRPTKVSLAPVRGTDGKIAGALLIGFVVSHQSVRQMNEVLGVNLGVFHAGTVQTSSFVTADGREDGNKTSALSTALFGGNKLAEQALASKSVSDIQRVTLDGEDYVAVAAPVPGNATDNSSGAVLLASVGEATDLASALGSKIWLLGILSMVVVLAATVLTAKRFITPLDKIELGVADIINGNIDYTFQPVGPDFEGLSNGLNVMLARLLGREEPSDEEAEEDESGQWKAEQMAIEEGDGGPTGSNPQGLAQESEAAYYPRLYNEYVNALRATGQRGDGVPVQLFTAKLRLVEGGLKRKWNCRMVRFQLISRGGQPVFQAVRIA